MDNFKPILLLLYKRPIFAEKQLELLLSHCNNHQIYVSIDGSQQNSKKAVSDVIRIVEKYKNQFKHSLIIRKVAKNNGCRIGVQDAIDWFFDFVDDGIILEDDCVPDPSFFKFATTLLNTYKNDMRIGMISGTNPIGTPELKSSYFFSHQSIIWGWATWKNRWQDYHTTVKNAALVLTDQNIKKHILTKTTTKHFSTFKKVINNKIDTWDYIWYFTNIIQSRLCIIPTKNLISNIGFAVDATHTTIITNQSKLKTDSVSFPLIHPRFFTIYSYFEKKYLQQVKLVNLLFSVISANIALIIKKP